MQAAIEILSAMHESAEGDAVAALGTALAVLKENLERVQDEGAEAEKMLRRVLPSPESPNRMAVWRHLRPMLRLSNEVLDDVERRLGEQR